MLPRGRSFARKTTPYVLMLALTGLAVPACTDDGGPAEPSAGPALTPRRRFASAAASRVIPGSYIVVFKPEVSDAPDWPTGWSTATAARSASPTRRRSRDSRRTCRSRRSRRCGTIPTWRTSSRTRRSSSSGADGAAPPLLGPGSSGPADAPAGRELHLGTTGAGVHVYIIDTGHPHHAHGLRRPGGRGASQPSRGRTRTRLSRAWHPRRRNRGRHDLWCRQGREPPCREGAGL